MDPPRLAEVPNVPIRTLVGEISIVLYVNNHASKTILRKLQIISYSCQTAIANCGAGCCDLLAGRACTHERGSKYARGKGKGKGAGKGKGKGKGRY